MSRKSVLHMKLILAPTRSKRTLIIHNFLCSYGWGLQGDLILTTNGLYRKQKAGLMSILLKCTRTVPT